MEADFVIAYNITLGHEGIYSNNPNDPGGETYKGIARNIWPDWEGWKIIDDILKSKMHKSVNEEFSKSNKLQSEVARFYKKEFWDKANLSLFPQLISNEIFDTGVNQGLKRAVKYFQKSLNLLNQDQKTHKDIDDDGVIGGKTKFAFDRYMLTSKYKSRSYERNLNTLLKLMNGLQLYRYISITEENKKK